MYIILLQRHEKIKAIKILMKWYCLIVVSILDYLTMINIDIFLSIIRIRNCMTIYWLTYIQTCIIKMVLVPYGKQYLQRSRDKKKLILHAKKYSIFHDSGVRKYDAKHPDIYLIHLDILYIIHYQMLRFLLVI